ncbi:MAG: urate hydroxylase PuuD [Gammaproteobacteria bacterium]|nr:urate hydroxylase PuuD [Gammaproteobacteria bacterium]MDH3769336.1 urate hydroxylase PuuD [Gammaproteobacteria bacterium]
MALVDFLFRWGHVLFGITWIGILYYFNFIQGSYFAEADGAAKADATKKLVPRALWWFRWGAMFTFLTGVYLLYTLGKGVNQYILLGAIMGIFMFLNVWLIIWPAQKIVIGLSEGDAGAAGPKALRASRTNTLFSAPMLFGMLGSKHGTFSLEGFQQPSFGDMGFLVPLVLILLLEANGVFGKIGPMKSVVGVIHSSLALTAIMFALVHFL